LVSTGLSAAEEVTQLVVEFAMFVVICSFVRMCLVTAVQHSIAKHFNFMGDGVPREPPLTPHSLRRSNLKGRRRGLTGVYPCVKKVLVLMRHMRVQLTYY
jgi:hypothetical protein